MKNYADTCQSDTNMCEVQFVTETITRKDFTLSIVLLS